MLFLSIIPKYYSISRESQADPKRMGETTGHVLWGSRKLDQERRELPSEDVRLGLRDMMGVVE